MTIPATSGGAGSTPDVEAYLEATAGQRLQRYLDFLRIPSISGIPEHAPDCRRAAGKLADDLRAAGLEHVEVSETGGHPIVYADWLHAGGAPTVLLYGHYDVQPVDPVDEWEAAPFEPIVRDGRVLARGASDDKSNISIALAAAEALLAARGALPVNLRLVFEGEEESSSVHLEPWLVANAERLTADVALVADSGFFAGNVPAITVGLRGLAAVEIHVQGPFQDVHSGVYGGAVENPINALAGIIATLKGPDGRIRVPGFYDDVVPLSPAERAAMAALPFDEEALRRRARRAGARRGVGLDDAGASRRAPDPRRQRHLGRLLGRGHQDDHPRPGGRQGHLPPRGEPGPGPDLRAAARPTSRRSPRPASGSRSSRSAVAGRR